MISLEWHDPFTRKNRDNMNFRLFYELLEVPIKTGRNLIEVQFSKIQLPFSRKSARKKNHQT